MNSNPACAIQEDLVSQKKKKKKMLQDTSQHKSLEYFFTLTMNWNKKQGKHFCSQ
jgi:hypothetical protein